MSQDLAKIVLSVRPRKNLESSHLEMTSKSCTFAVFLSWRIGIVSVQEYMTASRLLKSLAFAGCFDVSFSTGLNPNVEQDQPCTWYITCDEERNIAWSCHNG